VHQSLVLNLKYFQKVKLISRYTSNLNMRIKPFSATLQKKVAVSAKKRLQVWLSKPGMEPVPATDQAGTGLDASLTGRQKSRPVPSLIQGLHTL
jgi:hypothetical protein